MSQLIRFRSSQVDYLSHDNTWSSQLDYSYQDKTLGQVNWTIHIMTKLISFCTELLLLLHNILIF